MSMCVRPVDDVEVAVETFGRRIDTYSHMMKLMNKGDRNIRAK